VSGATFFTPEFAPLEIRLTPPGERWAMNRHATWLDALLVIAVLVYRWRS